MRSSRRHSLPAAHDRSGPSGLHRGGRALPDRSCRGCRGGVSAMDSREKREAIVEALLPDVPFDGWTLAAAGGAAQRLGFDEAAVASLFPGGARDLVAAFSRWADRRMLTALAAK